MIHVLVKDLALTMKIHPAKMQDRNVKLCNPSLCVSKVDTSLTWFQRKIMIRIMMSYSL